MRVKTSELTNLALRWAVAKAEELDVFIPAYADTPWLQVRCDGNVFMCPNWDESWTYGGPIIEQEGIAVVKDVGAHETALWNACRNPHLQSMFGFGGDHYHVGPTALTAAMRCYVASKLGDEVDVPEELLT